MKKTDLENCPQWLLDATTKNENVELIHGVVIWRGGEWRDGVWHDGEWRGGEWRGGEWRDGVWRGGVWRGGEWRGGVWCGGEWCGGVWRGGVWCGGVWRGGVWCGGARHWFHLGFDLRGYRFTLEYYENSFHIIAGCRHFNFAQAREHWIDDTENHQLIRIMLDTGERVAREIWKKEL